ncbi:hypothetical protein F5Y17DRAFT_231718 [Xylariaceae sp. FL0594]|nr:hypothetical protein F5Y17DRAFT_231718 [Xylariaceae sp. FL0594]
MPRKGNIKVRTGCLTCKARKVKCDEEKPNCKRCTSTGRKCDGYASPAAESTALSWHRPRHLFSHVNQPAERRCLQFFYDVAAPTLSGPLDPYFWTHLTMQFGQMEPAVRHSMVAVASLYEEVHRNPNAVYLQPDNDIALKHYNAAIHYLKEMDNESLVLLVCVMFICVEFLRGNRQAAAEHCRHGISILSRVENAYPWTKEYLSPIFRRLSLIPTFFSVGDKEPFQMLGLDDVLPASFASLGDAEYYLEGLLGRTFKLVRSGDAYRLGSLRKQPVPPELLTEQSLTRAKLDQWHSLFRRWAFTSPPSGRAAIEHCNNLMRYRICRVWVETPFAYFETEYDKHIDTFRLMVDCAAAMQTSTYCLSKPKFTFEMGFMPLLYFVVVKCRCLETRLQALKLMRIMGAARENLWDIAVMFAAARRIIEIEHGARVSDDGALLDEPSCPGFPADEARVRDTMSEPYPVTETVDGVDRVGRLGGFFRRTADDKIYIQSEFMPQPAWYA